MPYLIQEQSPDCLKNAVIDYAIQQTPWGSLVLGGLEGQLCLALFIEKEAGLSVASVSSLIQQRWPAVSCRHNPKGLPEPLSEDACWQMPLEETGLPILLVGSSFQRRVWKALLAIPSGQTVSYQSLAARSACPSGPRAVGQAVGANPISLFVPCHRVIRSDGGLGGYHWGLERKRALLLSEGCPVDN